MRAFFMVLLYLGIFAAMAHGGDLIPTPAEPSSKPEQPVKITRRADGSEVWCYGNRCEIKPAKSVLTIVGNVVDAATPNREVIKPVEVKTVEVKPAEKTSVTYYSSQRVRLFRRWR